MQVHGTHAHNRCGLALGADLGLPSACIGDGRGRAFARLDGHARTQTQATVGRQRDILQNQSARKSHNDGGLVRGWLGRLGLGPGGLLQGEDPGHENS